MYCPPTVEDESGLAHADVLVCGSNLGASSGTLTVSTIGNQPDSLLNTTWSYDPTTGGVQAIADLPITPFDSHLGISSSRTQDSGENFPSPTYERKVQ
ncbi:MAG: hypothetical protein ACP5OR_04410 [Candidatus Dormibacteria bacterium]